MQVAVIVVHYFRMPAFFLLSGFFSGLLWERNGALGFLRQRLKRIGFVWLAALVVLSPVLAFISVYDHFAQERAEPLRRAIGAVMSLQIDATWLQPAPLHLWFLEYLMLFCIAAAAVLPRIEGILPTLDGWTATIFQARFRIAILAIPSAVSIWNMPSAIVPYPDSFLPSMEIVLIYGWFFVVGWLLYRRRDLLPLLTTGTRVENWAVPLLVLAVALLLQTRARIGVGISARQLDLGITFAIAMLIWSIIVVLLAAAVRRTTPSKSMAYVADASYWIYLAHYPLTSLMPALLRHWPVPPVIKVGFSALFIFVLLLLAYQQFVRETAIGRALKGRWLNPADNLTRATSAGTRWIAFRRRC